jgi:hypothetical protein
MHIEEPKVAFEALSEDLNENLLEHDDFLVFLVK